MALFILHRAFEVSFAAKMLVRVQLVLLVSGSTDDDAVRDPS